MSSRKVGGFSLIAAAVLACVWFFCPSPEDEPQSPSDVADADMSARAERRKHGMCDKSSRQPKAKNPVRKRSLRLEDEFESSEYPYSAKDKQLAKTLQDALDAYGDGEDRVARKNLLAWAAKAAASANPDVRQRAIDAYSWIGKDALAELTPLMADPNADVADSAIGVVECTMTDIDDSALQFALASSYLSTFRANTDAMTMLAGVMEGAAMSIIDPDDEDDPSQVEKAWQNRMDVVDALATMIESGGKLAEHAKESYVSITGEDWISADEATLWAEDPQQYSPPQEYE